MQTLATVHTHIEFNAGFFNPTSINRPGAPSENAGYALQKLDDGITYDVDSFVESDPAENGFSTRPYPIIEQIFNDRMGG